MRTTTALSLALLGTFAVACGRGPSTDSAKPVASLAVTAVSAVPPSAMSAPPTTATATPSAAASVFATTASGKVAKISTDKIDPAGKAVADKMSKAFVDALKGGKFSDSADLADDLKKVTDAQWKGVFDGTKAKYGDEKSMDFVDAWNDEKGGTWYRYKAGFAKADKVEFRVDLNGQNKSTKFGTYDWVDTTP